MLCNIFIITCLLHDLNFNYLISYIVVKNPLKESNVLEGEGAIK